MGGPHKHNPIPFRPGIKPGDPDGDREWLLAYADETGLSVSAIISQAVAKYRASSEHTSPLRDATEAGTANRAIAGSLRGARETAETTGETQCR